MKLPVIKHEDERRTLTEWISDIPIKRCKIIEVKGKVILGNHYHHNSDSVFYMMRGKGVVTLRLPKKDARIKRDWLCEGEGMFVPRGIVHTFELLKGSIMLEAASEPYDSNDEIQFTE